MRDFVLTDELLKIQGNVSDYYIPNEIDIAGKSDHDLARFLNEIADNIQVSSENIADPVVFDKIRSFLKYFTSVQPRILSRLFDIILSAFRVEIKSTKDDLDQNEKDTFNNHRNYLELYSYSVHWFLLLVEDNTTTSKMVVRRAKNSTNDLKTFDWSTQKLKAFDLASWLLDLKLSKIWTLTPDRVHFVTLFTKPAYQLFENPAHAKSSQIKERIFRILSLCIKNYDHLHVAQTTIMQNLQYWEHSAEPMAELLIYMVEKENYNQLADEILREISNREFKDTTTKEVKDSPNPKTFATFLQKLADLSPKTILKNLGVLINQLDSDSYMMRTAIVDILGNMIIELSRTSQDNPNQVDQINDFFDILEHRMLDPTAYVRQKVLQVYLRLFELKAKFPKRRQAATELAIRHLQDKSSIVRKYAIRVLTTLISTHPYIMYGGELNLEEWNSRLLTLRTEIENVALEKDPETFVLTEKPVTEDEEVPVTGDEEKPEQDEDTEMKDASAIENETTEEADKENQPGTQSDNPLENPTERPITTTTTTTTTRVSPEKLQQLVLMRTFHVDAVKFIEQIHIAIPIITQLLSSKSKAEVLESMDFLVIGYNYKVKLSTDGIKKMLHLIWTKDTSDEGKGIKMKLLSCYENLYLSIDSKRSKKDNVSRIAKNLIELTYNTNLAELTSLEQVLSTLMKENKVAYDVIEKLWSVYGFTKGRIQKSQRRGAIIILGMLAKAKTKIVSEKIDLMLKIGLGPLGKADQSLSRYTCMALQRLEGIKTKEKGRGVQEGIRFPIQHPIFSRLKDVIENTTASTEWFSLAEQAINTIYKLCENPEILCETIIRDKTIKVFGMKEIVEATNNDLDSPNDVMALDYDLSMTQQALPFPQHAIHQSSSELSQLLFLVGHIALKQIVHLEIIESAWKRKKAQKETVEGGNNEKTEVDDELEQVGGTAEDDIGEALIRIREREILFGPNSLLGRFGPLLSEVCARNKVYTDRTLQITATLALAKFMCVSSDFCEKNLQLLFTILEKSKDATIRSNIVIALGDMAVCFNTLIDDNITFLYNRLSDSDTIVKKNTVMVLTHLILNGMVKVKGQISEMAKCLEDSDQRIVDLAKLFFTELASKDNAIYNNLPDIISNLTSTQPERLEEESFKRIMKFIFSFDFTEKEKQAENIVDKLCQRFLTAQDERNWRDIAYCLSLLPFKTEKTFKKLLEGWPSYQDKIHEDAVHKSFLEIISKGRFQKTQKPELKALIDELEQKVEKQRGGPEVVEKPDKTTKKATRVVKTERRKSKQSTTTTVLPTRELRKRKRVIQEDELEEEESNMGSEVEMEQAADDDDEEEEEEEVLTPRRRNRSSQEQKKSKEEEEEEDEEDEEEEDDD